MKYTEFCTNADHISSLTKLEIENPYLVIDELYQKRTMEAFHADLRILQSTICRDNEWKNHNPADLYTTFEDITRLLDALFLINEHSPELSTRIDTSASIKSNNEQIIAINKLFKKDAPATKDQDDPKETNPATILSAIYSVHWLHVIKEDLFNCLQIGLDVSYMENTKHEYFGGCENDYTLFFSTLEDLITEMYQIYLKEASVFQSLTSYIDAKFASDSDHPSHLVDYIIKTPYRYFFDFYRDYIDHNYIYTGLTAWKQLLFEKDVWKEEHNPGNLLHLNQCLIELIDLVWLLIQKKELQIINENYIAKKSYKRLINACDIKEFNNPIIAIENFMAYKKIHEWKTLLHKWLKCSLNNDHDLTDNRDQTDAEFNLLIKFTEAVLLLSLSGLKKI